MGVKERDGSRKICKFLVEVTGWMMEVPTEIERSAKEVRG